MLLRWLINMTSIYNAPLGPKMTWESHKIQYEQRQLNLQRLITRAERGVVAIDPEADTLGSEAISRQSCSLNASHQGPRYERCISSRRPQ